MATIYYNESDHAPGGRYGGQIAPASEPAGMAHWMNIAGAIVSVGLVVGMGVWAWQLTVRDVSGVPVIEALEGPMRVPPADPGGSQAPHQGLAVNRIAEGAEAEPVPDRVVLAPPPIELDDVALQSASLPEASEIVTPEAVNTETQALIDRLMSRGDALDVPSPEAPPALIDSDAADAEDAEAAPETDVIQVIPESVPGVARSLRPSVRPAGLRSRAAAVPEAASDPVTRDLDPEALPSGTRLVQLGAFDAPEIAQEQWAQLETRFPDFFAGRSRVIQQANSGGSTFYRLRAHGFDDLDASRRFCTALMAQGAACIPVTVR